MRGQTVIRRFVLQSLHTPDAMALVGQETSLSYRELNRRGNRLARRLVKSGVAPGDHVALIVPRSVHAVIGMLAILKAGAAFVPIDPAYPDVVKRDYLRDCGARHAIVVAESAFPESMDICCVAVAAHEIGEHDDDENVDFSVDENSLAYIMFTSGSTGRPKGVMIPHRGVIRLVCETNYIDIERNDSLLLLSPITFDASTFEIWGALLNGARLVVYEREYFDPHALQDLMTKERVSVLWLSAGLFHLVARHESTLLRGLRILLAGGDVLQPSMVHKVLDEFPGLTVINGYGPTENTTFTCCHRMTRLNRPGATVPIGVPVSGTQIRILDASMQPVGDGHEGELFVGGQGVALGYLNAAEATRAAFVHFPDIAEVLYRTGDLVRKREDGAIEFLGRFDHQVKIRGFRVSLDELRNVIVRIPGVQDALIVVTSDPTGEKKLTALVQTRSARVDMVAFIRAELRASIPSFMMPGVIKTCTQLPLNRNGKPDRNAIVGDIACQGERNAEYNGNKKDHL